jgi:hypothetical protein
LLMLLILLMLYGLKEREVRLPSTEEMLLLIAAAKSEREGRLQIRSGCQSAKELKREKKEKGGCRSAEECQNRLGFSDLRFTPANKAFRRSPELRRGSPDTDGAPARVAGAMRRSGIRRRFAATVE